MRESQPEGRPAVVPTHRRWRTFIAGAVSGVVLWYGGRYTVNRTTFADHLVSPLLRDDTRGTADLIVVLGAGVIGDCTPNMNGTRRVLLAARLYQQRRAPAILFTGGTGDGGCPVADAMARQAIEVGVPATQISREPTSRSTYENAARSAPAIAALGATRVLLVTDRLHMPRAEAVFRHFGFAVERAAVPIYEGHENNVDMLLAGTREGLALGYYRLRGWLAPGPASPVAAARAAGREGRGMSAAVQFPDGPIVVLGASYAASWPIEQLAGHRVVNRGVAGEESAALLARFERDVTSAAPRAVILWGFINDIFRAQGDMPSVLARVREQYTRMIAQARAAGIEPILATEVTARPAFRSLAERAANLVGGLLGKRAYQDGINEQVVAVNGWLRETAAREGLLLLDFQAVLAEESGRRHPAFSQPDGSHIPAAGYDALTAYVSPILDKHFREY